MAGRPKHIYSIWRKLQRKGLSFEEMYDLLALRILVDDVAACYAALGVVHGLWRHIAREFDDYIAAPKDNYYRSLHTAVMGPGCEAPGDTDTHPRYAPSRGVRCRLPLAL